MRDFLSSMPPLHLVVETHPILSSHRFELVSEYTWRLHDSEIGYDNEMIDELEVIGWSVAERIPLSLLTHPNGCKLAANRKRGFDFVFP